MSTLTAQLSSAQFIDWKEGRKDWREGRKDSPGDVDVISPEEIQDSWLSREENAFGPTTPGPKKQIGGRGVCVFRFGCLRVTCVWPHVDIRYQHLFFRFDLI
jgi:hypothetical protein